MYLNLFRTTKRDHSIPSDVMRRALLLSPGKDWTDKRTKAYEYLKEWALKQDEKIDGKQRKELTRDLDQAISEDGIKGSDMEHKVYGKTN